MSGNKRQRELARAKYERQQARRQQSAGRRRRNQRIIAAVVVAALVLGSVAWVVLARSSSSDVAAAPDADAVAAAAASAAAAADAAASPSPVASTEPTEVASAEPTAVPSGQEEPIEEPAILDCSPPGTPRPDTLSFSAAPAAEGAASGLILATNCGDIVIALDPAAPATVASAAFLAEQGFYDSTQCHRLTTAGIYVLQCGDPRGDGTGGPGYALPDENLPAEGEANYPAGTVAMANAGPGTGGSQFFIVYQDTTLPSGYTIWGTVTEGLDIVQEIASVGVADGGADGPPRQPVFIESATVQP